MHLYWARLLKKKLDNPSLDMLVEKAVLSKEDKRVIIEEISQKIKKIYDEWKEEVRKIYGYSAVELEKKTDKLLTWGESIYKRIDGVKDLIRIFEEYQNKINYIARKYPIFYVELRVIDDKKELTRYITSPTDIGIGFLIFALNLQLNVKYEKCENEYTIKFLQFPIKPDENYIIEYGLERDVAIKNIHRDLPKLETNSPLVLNKSGLRKDKYGIYPTPLEKYTIAALNIVSADNYKKVLYPSNKVLTLIDRFLSYYTLRNGGKINYRVLNLAIYKVLEIFYENLYEIEYGDLVRDNYLVIVEDLEYTKKVVDIYRRLKVYRLKHKQILKAIKEIRRRI